MISFFIPTCNGEKYLARTLESVLAQTYGDFEVICVDDLSTDSTYDILKSLAQKDSRVHIFRKSHDGDVPHSWQYAFPLFRGEYVFYMSQDDMLASDALEKMIMRQKETKADAVLPCVIRTGRIRTRLCRGNGIFGIMFANPIFEPYYQ